MAALASALPSPAAPVSATARGSSSRVVKVLVPALALATTPSSRAAERSRLFMAFISRKVFALMIFLADRELRVPRRRGSQKHLCRGLGTHKAMLQRKKSAIVFPSKSFGMRPGADAEGLQRRLSR